MMYSEFLAGTGLSASPAAYHQFEVIETIYTDCQHMTKQEAYRIWQITYGNERKIQKDNVLKTEIARRQGMYDKRDIVNYIERLTAPASKLSKMDSYEVLDISRKLSELWEYCTDPDFAHKRIKVKEFKLGAYMDDMGLLWGIRPTSNAGVARLYVIYNGKLHGTQLMTTFEWRKACAG